MVFRIASEVIRILDTCTGRDVIGLRGNIPLKNQLGSLLFRIVCRPQFLNLKSCFLQFQKETEQIFRNDIAPVRNKRNSSVKSK